MVETAVSTVVTARDRVCASLDRERILDRERTESQWRREQRLRELQAMEEEHLRGEPTVLVQSFLGLRSVIRLPARLTEELWVIWPLAGWVGARLAVSASQLWRWQLHKRQSTEVSGKSRKVAGQSLIERTRP